MKSIDIVIPFYSGGETIRACLDSVAAQQIPAGWQTTVTVVDDASPEAAHGVLEEVAAQHDGLDIQLRTNAGNCGRAGTCNRGAQSCHGQIVVILDCDCVFENPHVLERYIAIIEDGADCVFANVISRQEDFSGRYTNDLARDRMRAAQQGRYLAMTSAGLAIRRDVFMELGGFSEDYSHYGFEDRDFIALLQRRGSVLAVDRQCQVVHLDTYDPTAVSRKLAEAARYSAPVFYRRFPDVYRHMVYGRIDPRLHAWLPGFAVSLAVRALPLATKLAAGSIHSGKVPYPVGKFFLKLTSLLSYLGGCLEREE